MRTLQTALRSACERPDNVMIQSKLSSKLPSSLLATICLTMDTKRSSGNQLNAEG